MSGRVHETVKIACVQDCAFRVVLVYLMWHTNLHQMHKCFGLTSEKNGCTYRGSYCYAFRLPHKIYRRCTS